MKSYIATALAAAAVLAFASPAFAISARSARADALTYAQQHTGLAKVAYPETSYRIAGCARRSRARIDCGVWATNRTGRYYAIERLADRGHDFLLDFVAMK
jgi:O-acetyl-ADP-ribose deacetylase (regulator of RNase III)